MILAAVTGSHAISLSLALTRLRLRHQTSLDYRRKTEGIRGMDVRCTKSRSQGGQSAAARLRRTGC